MYTPASFVETNPEKLHEFIADYEAGFDQPWAVDLAEPDFVDGLLDAIVGFVIPIERLEGKWKLSQNHSGERRQRVVNRLRTQGDENSVAIADLMSSADNASSAPG